MSTGFENFMDKQNYEDFYTATVGDFIKAIKEQGIPLDTPMISYFNIEGKKDKEAHVLTYNNSKEYKMTRGHNDGESYKYKEEESDGYLIVPLDRRY